MSSMKDRLDKSTEMKLKRQIAELKKVEFFIGTLGKTVLKVSRYYYPYF